MTKNEIPKHIKDVTKALAEEYPPTNPVVILDTAQWWYKYGEGASDPIFRQAISWLAETQDIDPMDFELFKKFEERLDEVL